MAKLLRLRRGTSTQHTTFTGAEGEVTVNTTNDSLHVHDGTTAGGTELAKADLSNVDGSLSNNLGFADNTKAQFGASNDLEIYHDSNASFIDDVGTGDLRIRANNLSLRDTNDVSYLYGNSGGAVNLYHNGLNKLATTSSGINVTGSVTCDGLESDGTANIRGSTPQLILTDTDSTGTSTQGSIVLRDSGGNNKYHIGDTSGANENFEIRNYATADVLLSTNNGGKQISLTSAGHWVPADNNAQDLGTSSAQWRDGYFDGTVNCDGLTCEGTATIQSGTGVVVVKDSDSTGNAVVNYIVGQDSSGGQKWYYGYGSSSNQDLYVSNSAGGQIQFQSSGTTRFTMQAAGHLVPETNNAQDLGTSANRWRNVYTNDLNLSNEGGANDVDGTWGSWTIQEGEDDLFLLNRRNGKKYKFNLSEVN